MTAMEIQLELQKKLGKKRFYHSLGVSYTCACMAMALGEDMKRAELAGILHDCAKYLTNEDMLAECERAGLPISAVERLNPQLLHGKLGAHYAKTIYGVEDAEILSAIACHTTGKPAMTKLEAILFVADYMEPSREGLPGLDEIRVAAFRDLDRAVLIELSSTMRHLEEIDAAIDPTTKETYEYYMNKNKEESA